MNRIRPTLFIASTALLAFCLTSCHKDRAGGGAPQTADKVLDVYIWADYLPEPVLAQFTKESGIKVNVVTYESNEKLLDTLQSGGARYDIVVPSDYTAQVLIAQKLVQPLDRAKLKGLENLDPQFLDKKYDPGNKYSLPYFWGTTGLGYNRQKVTRPVDSWDVLFDPANSQQVLMLDDMRECFAVALKRLGRSVNESDPAVLKQAADMLKAQKPLVRVYDNENYDLKLKGGDVAFAHGYNGQLSKWVRESPDKLAYVVPKEGATLWIDNVCIPAKSSHAENAYAFLNFILRPQVNAQIADAVSYATPNVPARKLIKPEIANDPNVYPPPEVIKRCEVMDDLGDKATLLDRYWTEIKAK